MIERIYKASIHHYADNGQTRAYVEWRDKRGMKGTTCGDPNNTHMYALLTRAKREGIPVEEN